MKHILIILTLTLVGCAYNPQMQAIVDECAAEGLTATIFMDYNLNIVSYRCE